MPGSHNPDRSKSSTAAVHRDENDQQRVTNPAPPGTDQSEEQIRKRQQQSLDAPGPGEELDGGESTLSGERREAGTEYPTL